MRVTWWWASWAACAACASWALGALLPEAERLRAGVGGFAVMNCHLDFPFGIEIPYHLQWDKDGEVIFSWYSGEGTPRVAERWAGRVRRVGGVGDVGDAGDVGGAGGALGGGAVNVSSVREADAGLYRCRVAFPNRTPPARNNGTFYYLDVDGGNLIATPPSNVTVLEGERAELVCLPKSAEWRVTWRRDGAAAAAAAAANGSLVLARAAAGDAGRYECAAAAADGRAQTASAWLDVQFAARVLHAPPERHLPLGKAASLDCQFSANPPLTNLRWEKDGFLFDPYNVPGVFYSRNGSLLFNRVDESHAGVYSCTPYNALGTAGASSGVRVRVLRPPALAAAPPPLVLARLGHAVTLPCAAAAAPGAPPPAVRWARKDGRALPPGRHALAGGNLTLRGVAPDDRGVYVCRVANAAAELAAESELLVENAPPRAPHALAAAAARDGRSVRVTWAWGAGGADADAAVWYRERGAGEWRTMRVPTRGAAAATLLGLRPGAEYELRVLAQDRIGDGLFSKPVFVRTADPEFDERDGTTEYAAETDEAAVTDAALGTRAATVATAATAAADADADDAERWSAAGDQHDYEDALDVLNVSVRLIEEGALVMWRRGADGADGADAADGADGADAADGAECELRWYDDAAPERRLLAARRTAQDYALVGSLQEGGAYWAAVRCGAARGGAALAVPRWARLRGAALGAAGGALLLAALAGALCAARRRLRQRRAKRAHH